MTTFAKRRPSHTEICEAVCETNPIISLRNKRHLTYLCDAICITKVSQTKTIWLDKNSTLFESLQERNGGEGGYLQMLLWGPECHLALACGWWVEPISLALLPWGTSMVDHQPRPPLIGIQQASALMPSSHNQTSPTLLPSWPWLAAMWSPSAALLLSATPQIGRRHSRCLLRTKAASLSSCTHSGLSSEHESSSCRGILFETLNWRSCL